MKFMTLRLRNWRSFLGDQVVEFSTDDDKPVTLLLGPNGAGKTALLNAFTWGLYAEFTDGFDGPDQLVNLEAVGVDSGAETWVELLFEHVGDEYRIRRSTDARRQLSQDYSVDVTKNGEPAVEHDVHRILPKALRDLFFFPAESFSTASVLKEGDLGEGTSIDVGKAIRALLSGDVYAHAGENIRKAFDSDALKPPMNYKDETIKAAHAEYVQAQAELNAAEERKDLLPGLLATARDAANKAKKEAAQYDPAKMKAWEQEYQTLDNAVKAREADATASHRLYEDLARNCHRHFAQHAVSAGVERLDLAEKAGIMPPRIHEGVLDRTLESGCCSLCGEHLTATGKTRVETLQSYVGGARIAVRGLETRTLLKRYADMHGRELVRLRNQVNELGIALKVNMPAFDGSDMGVLGSVLRSCIDVADSLLAEANRKFDEFKDQARPETGKSPVEIAMARQKYLDALTDEHKTSAHRISELDSNVDRLFNDYQKKSGKSKAYAVKTSAIGTLKEAKHFFDCARKGLEEYGRLDFEKAINTTFSDLIAKPFSIRVGDDFSISVFIAGGEEPLPLSQSEKVLVLIAFLGAIARLAPEYEEIAKAMQQLERTGAVETSRANGFPVVLDSPTSPLDDQYEADVVSALPKLLPQLIVPVSAKSVKVWEKISDSLGAIYVMELTSQAATDRVVRWRGKDYTYSAQDDGAVPARTSICRIV